MTDKRYTVRPAGGQEDAEAAARLLTSPGILDVFRAQPAEPGCIRILYDGNDPIGAICHRRERWEFGAVTLDVARVWEVSGESGERAFRITGERSVFDALVGDWCDYLRSAGYHLAYTHGELALWPVHGFYPCFFHPRVYIPVSKAIKLRGAHKVRSLKTSDARAVQDLMRGNAGLRPRVFAVGVPHFHHFVVEGPSRSVLGYFSMALDSDNGAPAVFIPEVEVLTREAAETILAHAAPFAKERGMRVLHFPLAAEHPFASACLDLGGYHQLRGTTRDVTLDEEMVRIVDVGSLLTALDTALALRLLDAGVTGDAKDISLDVEGEVVPLRMDAHGIRPVDDLSEPTRIRVPRWAFTQMVMGYRGAMELRKGTVSPDGARKLFSVLFPKCWPLSLCDHDLWDPSLRNPKKYGEKAKAEIRKLRSAF